MAGCDNQEFIRAFSNTGHVPVAQMATLIAVTIGKWVRIIGAMVICIYLVGQVVSMSMRFLCHIPRAFGAHEEHRNS